MEILTGQVRRVEILAKVPMATIEHATAIIAPLMELSRQRKLDELPYLTWTAHGILFGFLNEDVSCQQEMLQLSSQTHPSFHEDMTESEFQDLVLVYVDLMSVQFGTKILYVNFMPPHTLSVYQMDSQTGGRTSA